MRVRPGLAFTAFASAAVLAACSASRDTAAVQHQYTTNVADAALTSGAPDLALRVAELILRKDPNNADALAARGDALYALNQPDMARVSYKAAIAIDPRSARAEIGLGRTLARSDPRAAENAFRLALLQQPNDPVALNNLGLVLDLQNRHTEAQVEYRSALKLAPEMHEAEVNLGLSLALSGNAQEAVRMLSPLARQDGATPVWRGDLAVALAMSGNTAGAQKILHDERAAQDDQVAIASQVSTTAPVPSAEAGLTDDLAGAADAPVVKPAPVAPVRARAMAAPVVAPVAVAVAPPVAAVGVKPVTVASISPAAVPAPVTPPDARSIAGLDPSGPVALRLAALHPVIDQSLPLPAEGARPAPAARHRSGPIRAIWHESGGVPYVQLAALNTRSGADFEWHRLQHLWGDLLGDREPVIAPVTVRGRTYWRLRTLGFGSADEAGRLCSELRGRGSDCWAG